MTKNELLHSFQYNIYQQMFSQTAFHTFCTFYDFPLNWKSHKKCENRLNNNTVPE